MRSGRARRRPRGLVGLALAVSVTALIGCSSDSDTASRQATVASRGAEVMPFDLDATTHTFTKTDTGGLQVVTAHDPSDQQQIDLIRDHLRAKRTNFANGDFSDPARIHGMDMPGVSELSAGDAEITVHLERIDESVKPGVPVSAGQILGEIGNSGTQAAATGATNPRSLHLHWELHIDDVYLGAGLDPHATRDIYSSLFARSL